ncbi:Outer membrane protein beta-barrel domain-containing protein [Salegentibacter echinorum]|uniref:Outer membrane protein beta-barrel domain-containing protein n=1 Tax=Salegentibacter echinorum TaxID=1073325 RepID=A0A1M5BZV5_SALEC|nr:porin family protein [Salegentibacter echinorum]SHF47722.1 Outer membrane protein beta-barrel domain-containing protein [Salegentibacter echinorum]
MNRNFLLIVLSVLCFSAAQAQEYSFGVKAGGNYSLGGELEAFSPKVGSTPPKSIGVYEGQSSIGFQAGVFLELRFNKFFVRPEILFNQLESEYELPGYTSTYSIEKLNIPLLFGYEITDNFDVFAGPAYNNIINSSFDGTRKPNATIVVQDTPLAGQIGVKWTFLKRFEIDLRYEHMLTKKQITTYNMDSTLFVGGSGSLTQISFDDPRLNQIMLSLSFKIGDSESNTGRRRSAQSCYF